MKKITFIRPVESFNKNCSYRIVLGGTLLAELNNGEKKVIEISPGRETEKCKATLQWCGSHSFQLKDLPDDEIVYIRGNKFLNRTMPIMGGIVPIILVLMLNISGVLAKNIALVLLCLVMIGLIGTITVGKNRWISISIN